MPDKFHVYRPLLDLIGHTEGTDRGRGYDETLAYGAFTGGDVVLTRMTLDELDRLQTKMLKHPKNKLRSSAAGRYQIVRTTLRAIREQLGLTGSEKYDAAMQDRLACYLLGQRGIDKYLAGRLSEDTLLLNLAKEWASLPTPQGKGFYGGQHAAVKPVTVRQVLAQVKERHAAGQPKQTVEKPVVPETVEEKVKDETSWWQKLLGFFGFGGLGSGFLYGVDWRALAVIAVVLIVVCALMFWQRRRLLAGIREIREGLS